MASRDFSISGAGKESALLPVATYAPLVLEAATFGVLLTVFDSVAPEGSPARKLPELMLFELEAPVTPTSGTSEFMKA
jgi:hypothetical protein